MTGVASGTPELRNRNARRGNGPGLRILRPAGRYFHDSAAGPAYALQQADQRASDLSLRRAAGLHRCQHRWRHRVPARSACRSPDSCDAQPVSTQPADGCRSHARGRPACHQPDLDAALGRNACGPRARPETESPSEPADGDGERTARGHRSERKKRWPLWTAAAALLLLGVAGAGGYAYASHYADTAVPGTSVGGVDVSGKTREQIVELVSKRAQDAAVTISGDVEATASLEDLGTTIDAEATADAAMARSADVLDRFKALVTDNNVAVVTTANADTAASYAASLVPEDQAKAVDATVTLAADGASFTTTPAADGTGLDPAPLESTAAKAAQTLSSQTVELSYTTVAPTVSDADAQAAADKANGLVGLDVTVATTDASSSFTADAPTKASWITIKPGQDSKPAVSVDAAKVGEWVAAQSAQVSKDPVTGQRNVNSWRGRGHTGRGRQRRRRVQL